MRHTTRSRRRTTAAVLALAFGLAACGGTELLAETSAAEGEADDERVEALEAQLAELRDDGETGDQDGDDATDTGDDPEVTEGTVHEVGETLVSGEREDLVVTLDRIVVHDYWIEAELTALNNHTESSFELWSAAWNGTPSLFDEQDRRFAYQHPAGMNDVSRVAIGPGERLEAVMVFGGRIHPDAGQLSLEFTNYQMDGWRWDVPLTGGQR